MVTQMLMLLPTPDADRIPAPLTPGDVDTRHLSRTERKSLGQALASRQSRFPAVEAALARGECPTYERVAIGEIRVPDRLRLPNDTLSGGFAHHYAMVLATGDARYAAGLDAIPVWRDAEGVIWLGQDAMIVQAIAPYAPDGELVCAVFGATP